MSSFNTPILFIVFNRKAIALKALEAIRELRPTKLYLAGDGHRSHVAGEAEKVAQTRAAVMAAIDWDCEVKTLFQDHNLGCGLGVYTAINWFFEQEEMGIILEDDCVAKPSFFTFSEELLTKYKDDERIALISGFNEVGSSFNDASYCFSKYAVCWGWATWRRAWKNMDYNMTWRGKEVESSILSNTGYLGKDYEYWQRRLEAIEEGKVSAWDYQWCFTVASQNQLGIFPNGNLISNIGFGEDATHSSKSPFVNYNAKEDLSFPLKHPTYMVPNVTFDKHFYDSRNSIVNTIAWYFPKPVKEWVKGNIGRFYAK